MIDPTEDIHHRDDGGDSGEDGPYDKVGPEDGAVPARAQGHGEDPGDHCVNRDSDGNDEDHHDADGPVQAPPLLRRVPPPQGEDRVELPAQPGGRPPQPVPGQGDVGDQRQVEIDEAAGDVGADGDDVPEDGGAQAAVEEDVGDAVRAPQVDDGHQATDHQGHHGDDLGHAGDGPAPLGVADPEDGGDEGAGVGDADEEDEVDDVEAPTHHIPHPRLDEAVADLDGVG